MTINKEAKAKTENNLISDEEMALINKYTRKKLEKDDVYTFSVTLCDNETDRDFEVFSLNALKTLCELFVGKTGITDHEAKSTNQTARIYKTELEYLEGVNAIGERKARLVAKAYIPVTEYTKDIISRIENGILKEVSVGCSVKKSLCNICGKEQCSHLKGKTYGDKLCIKILDEAEDAYEFSFVAVPAQRNAGVNKSFLIKEEFNLTEKLKNLKEGESVTLTFKEAKELKKAASWGENYRNSLLDAVRKASAILSPQLDGDIEEEMAASLDIEKLISLNKYFEAQLNKALPIKSQLTSTDKTVKNESLNGGFKI